MQYKPTQEIALNFYVWLIKCKVEKIIRFHAILKRIFFAYLFLGSESE